jgi:O-acetyl-ADP-ribose deacetylase (regulator of RNase III)
MEEAHWRNLDCGLCRAAIEGEFPDVAFPSVSTGVHGYDVKAAATIAVTTVSSYLAREASIREVIFCYFSAEDFAVYELSRHRLDRYRRSGFGRVKAGFGA